MSSRVEYLMSLADIENEADDIKRFVVAALVADGFIASDEADKWCANHTLICRKRSFFRTISDKWFKTEPVKDYIYIVVEAKCHTKATN